MSCEREHGSIPNSRALAPQFGAEQLALVARSLTEGIIVQALDGSTIWANDQSLLLLGMTQDQMSGAAPVDATWRSVHEDGSELLPAEHPATVALRTGKAQPGVVMGIHRSDGTTAWILTSASPLPGGVGVVTSLVDITERVLRERELRALHAREVAVLAGASVSIIGTQLDGTIHTFNAAAERMLGWTALETLGSLTPVAFHDANEMAERAAELGIAAGFGVFIHVARKDSAETRDWTYIRKDGTRFPVSLTVTAIRDNERRIIGFLGIAEDISVRKRVTAEHEKLALVASRTHNVVIVTDAHACAEWVNEAFTRLTGYELSEVKGRKIGPMVQGPETDLATVNKMRTAVRAGEGFQVEVLNYGKSGQKYWLDVDCRPFFGNDGQVLGFVAIETDVTARKAMEDKLRHNESRLRAFVEGLPDTVLRISNDGVIRDVHAADVHALPGPREEYIGRTLIEMLPPTLAGQLMEHIETVRTTTDVRTLEYQLEYDNSLREFEARIAPGARDDAIVIIRDVSERKLLERLKDEFVSTVSHELRTPLTAIHGTLGLLAGDVLGPLSSEARELVEVSLKNSDRLSRLIDDILDLDKVTRQGLRLECEPTSLAPLIGQAIREVEPFAAEFNVNCRLLQHHGKAVASIDADRFLQVLFNLLSNAAKYGNANDYVDVRLVAENAGWRISVVNRGPAIPDQFRLRMFNRFSMVDGSNRRSRRGTGLGLAITKALVELMGGTIDFVSNESETEFFIWLPAA